MIILFSVDKRVNNTNSENIDICQVDIKGRKGAHKHDTMGDVSNDFIIIQPCTVI